MARATMKLSSLQSFGLTFLGPILICVMFSITVFAQGYTFDSPTQQKQFQTMTEQLRCLVCQNESLWDSTAPLAKDLRTEIYNRIKSGDSETAIKQYLVARYGQFILFKPALNSTTYLLWIIPFILLVLAFSIVAYIVRRSRRLNT